MTNETKTITVTIPAQVFDEMKYICRDGRCYLEEALDKAGHVGASVEALGRTKINGKRYVTRKPFGASMLEAAFERGESVTVTLIRS